MTWLWITGGLLLFALLLPSGRTPLTVRYHRLLHPAAPPPQRRLLATILPMTRLLPLLPSRYLTNFQGYVLRANLADRWPIADLLAIKLLISLLLTGLTALFYQKTGFALFGYGMVLQAVAGFMLPDFWIKRREAGRREAVRRELPQLLSGLAICLHTGLSLRSALIELTTIYPGGVLGGELRLVAANLQAGANPREALDSMAERCGTIELTQALGALLQHAEKSPRAAGEAAAADARLAWLRRRRQAEAFAQSAALRLFIPQLLLGLPALFLVLLGPAALALIGFFRPN